MLLRVIENVLNVLNVYQNIECCQCNWVDFEFDKIEYFQWNWLLLKYCKSIVVLFDD